jgi:universal stress protein E
MMQIKSILVALGRKGDASQVLARSAMLARCFNAHIEIFLCEAERAFELQHQYDADDSDRIRQSGVAKSRAWVDRLWKSLDVNDVPVAIDVVYETPLFEAIARKAKRSKADLVVRGIGAGTKSTLSVSDFDLVCACPAPLLLTRGKPWRSGPTVAAAVDISGDESPERIRTILVAAQNIAGRCGAALELLYAARFDNALPGAEQAQRELLSARAAAADVHPLKMHVLNGDAARAIPEFVARCGYDLLVLGALTHRRVMTAQIGALTGTLVETVACDLLLVKPTSSDVEAWKV